MYKSDKRYGEMEVVGYIDNSYFSDFEDKKSITGYCFFLVEAIVIWYNKRLQTVSTSTSKAKYVVLS